MIITQYHSTANSARDSHIQCFRTIEKEICLEIEQVFGGDDVHITMVMLDIETVIRLQKHLKRLIAEVKEDNNGE
jgi:protein-arginine kinase activator protein McsA